MRAYDKQAIEELGVASLVLMENAGRGAAEALASRVTDEPVTVVAGLGNNGGDGFVIARHLAARGVEVRVFLMGPVDKVGGDARINLDAWRGLGGALQIVDDDLGALNDALARGGWAVDALFGTGLSRPLEGRFAETVEAINASACHVFAVDMPSGIDGDDGAVLGVAVRAELTATFAHLKSGLLQGQGATHAGEVVVVPLGFRDQAALEAVGWTAQAVEPSQVAATLGQRPIDTHKYRAGSVLVIAGSEGKTGAALLAGTGALRAGAGLVTIATWPDAVASLEQRVTELMTATLDSNDLDRSLEAALDRRRAVAMGPGLGLDDRATEVVKRVGLGWEGPVVLDADAISCFAGKASELGKAKGPRVITPHAGELARLMGTSSSAVEADRFGAARAAADATGAVVVLKGHRTVIARRGDDGLWINRTGHPVLATAGSGDVLTGMVGALLAAGSAPEDAACAAVHLHGLCGERWHRRLGADRGMIAHEIASELPAVLAELTG
jgi:NAD(P)H-hydrate epimerase